MLFNKNMLTTVPDVTEKWFISAVSYSKHD